MDHSQNVLGTPTNIMSKTNPKVGPYLNKGRNMILTRFHSLATAATAQWGKTVPSWSREWSVWPGLRPAIPVGQVNNMTKRPPFREAGSPLEGRLTINWNNHFFHEMIILPKGALSAAPRSHYEVQLGPWTFPRTSDTHLSPFSSAFLFQILVLA